MATKRSDQPESSDSQTASQRPHALIYKDIYIIKIRGARYARLIAPCNAVGCQKNQVFQIYNGDRICRIQLVGCTLGPKSQPLPLPAFADAAPDLEYVNYIFLKGPGVQGSKRRRVHSSRSDVFFMNRRIGINYITEGEDHRRASLCLCASLLVCRMIVDN
jgi:hypothetical protein